MCRSEEKMKNYLAYAAIALSLAFAVPAFAENPEPAEKGKTAAVVVPDGNMSRDNIPDIYKWNLSPLFADDNAFEKALKDSAAKRGELSSFKGTLGTPQGLAKCLKAYFDTRLLTNKITLYANLRSSTDVQDTKLQDMNERALAAMSDFMAKSAFIRDEVLALTDEQIEEAYKKEASLKEYKGWIDEVRRRKAHMLSPQEERILSLAGDNQLAEIDLNELPSGFEKAFQALYADIKLPVIKDEKGNDVQITFSNYGKYRASSDRRVRRDTVEQFFGTLNDYRHAFAALMAGQVEFSVFLARARGYDTALEAYLDKDNIDPAVYYNIINSVKANTAPLHRYVKMRKKMMGLDDIHLYDLYTPLVKSVHKEVTYEEALETIPKALAPLGPDYVKMVQNGLNLDNRWADVYPHKNKDSGASCASIFGVHPFVKLNYYNDIDDMSTVAHEFGHAMHSCLSFANQPYATAGYAPFVAEVASTCNEKLLSDYLIANAKTDEEKLSLLNEMVNTIRSTVYRQALFADFELQVHTACEKGTPITAELLDKIYRDLIREYYGPDFTIDENDGIEWAYIPHLYYKFYVFSYTAGLSSGIAIADNIKKNGEPARKAYIDMLSSGCSKSPVDLLKMAGVDLTKPDALENAAKCMDMMLDEIERIQAKKNK